MLPLILQKTVALILAAAATVAVAMCPNQCSGHGACTADDQCRCWKGYNGFDCSKRACPVVESWAVDNAEDPHAYQECAGKGICDSATGTCACFAGFEGRGCERSACPNACSGHGKCRMLADLDTYAAGRKRDSTPGSEWNALSWDEKAILTCECDGGYMGADCSQRICPHGDDPMTVCEQGNTEQVQQVVFKLTGDFSNSDAATDDFMGNSALSGTGGFSQQGGAMAMRFKSYANEVFYTNAVATPFTAGASTFETALEAVPNFRIRNVDVADVTLAGTTTELTSTYKVTFRHEGMNDNSYGEQNLLMCPHPRAFMSATGPPIEMRHTFGCASEGCSPKIEQPRATLLGVMADVTDITSLTLTAGDPTAAKFTADSVLTCPIGEVCPVSTGITYQGAIALVTVGFVNPALGTSSPATNDLKIYAKGFGSTAVAGGPTVGALSSFTYLGRYSDFPAEGSGPVGVKIDLSVIMPDTRYFLSSTAIAGGWVDGRTSMYFNWFTTAECASVSDITTGAQSFNNLDVENIECSGRGECDRSSGVCACFDGYTGLTCGEQTILI